MKTGYYIAKLLYRDEQKQLDIVFVQDGIFYAFGSDERYNFSELGIVAGPFTIDEILSKLKVNQPKGTFKPGDKVVITKVFTVLGNTESDEEFVIQDENGKLQFVRENEIWYDDENAPDGNYIQEGV